MSQVDVQSMTPQQRRRALAQLLAKKKSANEEAPIPLSEGQKAIWYIHQVDPQNSSLNLGEAVRVKGGLVRSHVRSAVDELAERHAELRRRLVVVSGEPFQQAVVGERLEVRDLSLSSEDPEHLSSVLGEFIDERFELGATPPLRFGVHDCENGDTIIVFALHHIAGEFWSLLLLIRDFLELYRASFEGKASQLPPLEGDYGDFVKWQNRYLRSPQALDDEEYWATQLEGAPGPLAFPPLSDVGDQTSALVSFELSPGSVESVREFARRQDVSTYSVLLSAFSLLLARRAGRDEVVIGAPMTGRADARFADVIGYFDNPLPVRLSGAQGSCIRDYVRGVRQRVLEAVEHQAFPLQRIVEEQRETGGALAPTPFNTMFVMRQSPKRELSSLTTFGMGESQARASVSGVAFESIPLCRRRAQFSLALSVADGDGQFVASWEYDCSLFSEQDIADLSAAYRRILEGLLRAPEAETTTLIALSEREQSWLNDGLNRTQGPMDHGALLHEPFERTARRLPEELAIVQSSTRVSYRELDERANAVAHYLRQQGVQKSSLVAVVMDKSWEQVVAVLGVLKAGAAYLPIDSKLPESRKLALVRKGHVRIGLTERVEQFLAEAQCSWTTIEELGRRRDRVLPAQVTPSDLAYTIFTSGSTGEPKGVMINHRGAWNTLKDVNDRLDVTPADRVLGLSSLSFDLSVYDIFGVLGAGGALVLPDADKTLEPGHWLDLCKRHAVSLWNSVPSLLRLALEQAEKGEGKDALESLRAVMLSGDWIPLDLPDRLRAFTSESRFISMGGATEGSVWSIWHEVSTVDPNWASIPYGMPMRNQEFYVLDDAQRPCPVGTPGELYIGGVGVTMGYFGAPDLTERALVDVPEIEGVLYRTGDLGKRKRDGSIEFLGRKDFQVKVRGFRVEIGEIETALQNHPSVSSCVVNAQRKNGENRLIAYVVGELNESKLRAHLAERLPDYMVPSLWVALDALPLSSNGKVDRKALPDPEQATRTSERAWTPTTEEEQLVNELVLAALPGVSLSPDADLISLGMDSIQVIQLASALQRAGYQVSTRDVFEHAQLPILVGMLRERGRRAPQPEQSEVMASHAPRDRLAAVGVELSDEDIARVLERFPAAQEVWALSPMQQTMLVHGLVENEPGLYCEHLYWRATGDIDAAQLGRAFSQVAEKVPSLRSAFSHGLAPAPIQVILPESTIRVQERWVKEEQLDAVLTELVEEDRAQGFDLTAPPLMRVNVLRLSAETSVVVLCHHHLLFDGWSVAVLLQAVLDAYGFQTVNLSEPEGYRDFIRWVGNQDHRALTDHWSERLRDAETPSALQCVETSTDVPFKHAQVDVEWDSEFVSDLKATAQQLRVTPSSLILGAWALALGRQTGSDEVTFGVTSSGRPENLPSSAETIGLFIATAPLRVELGKRTLGELFQEVHHQAIVAREYEHVSQADLARAAGVEARDFDPFHSVVIFENYPGDRVLSASDGSLTFGAPEFTEQTNTPCALYVLPGETWKLRITYDGARFGQEGVLALMEQVQMCLAQAKRAPTQRLVDVSLFSPHEEEMWTEFNDTRVEYDGVPTLTTLLANKATTRPDDLALIDQERSLSYGELYLQAQTFAARLIEHGVKAGDRVALYTDRTAEMIIGIYGILVAGAAYVPLEKKVPEPQIKRLLSVAEPHCIAVAGEVPDWLQDAGNCIEIDGSTPSFEQELPQPSPDGTAYVIFTSGSTGEPKGVEISHAAVHNYARSVPHLYGWRSTDRVLQFCSIAFDAAAEEIFGSLAAGAQLVLRPEHMLESYRRFNEVVVDLKISVMSLPTAVWHTWAESLGAAESAVWNLLRVVIIGGERVRPATVAHWNSVAGSGVQLFNTYGPTETTIVSLMSELSGPSSQRDVDAPIGRPVPNTEVYVLDDQLRPSPLGVPGELYIGGAGLARGYLGSPDQTVERFAPFLGEDRQLLYRTGDRVRMRADGQLEFCGRVDEQVKVRGYRVEPGAIEAVAQECPAVREVVVTSAERAGQTTLVGYFSAHPDTDEPVAALREWLKRELPEYMNPSLLIELQTLPLTVRGKVDRSALPAPSFDTVAVEKTIKKPSSLTEKKIAAIWCELLGVSEVGVDEEFFDVGGHSLLALKLLSRLQSELQLETSLQGFFAGPTIEKIASLGVSAQKVEEKMRCDALQTFHWTAPPAEPLYEIELILLTGATGFLGTFILGELLANSQATIWCLVRAESTDQAMARISGALEEAGLWSDEYRSRVRMLCGDLGAEKFGLSHDVYDELSRVIDTVVHNGARVNFAEPYESLRQANVVGTCNVIEFAAAVRAKGVHYVSTLGIFDTGPDAPSSYAERWIDDIVRPLPSGYGQTKWVAERLMTRARDGGLPVSIYRPGRVSGHSKTAVWSDDDLVCQMIAACSAVSAAPSLDMAVDLTPVDYVARAIVNGALNGEFGRVLHLVNPNPSSLDELVPMLSSIVGPVASVELEDWIRRVEDAAPQDPQHPWLQLTALLPQWKEMLRPTPDGARRFECNDTVDHLQTRGIHCPPVDDTLLQTYVRSLQERGVVRSSAGGAL